MTMQPSLKKRQANRRNALRSTGPKSAEGRKRSSSNSLDHGLSVPIAFDHHDPLVASIIQLLAKEELDPHSAKDLALKIVEYERNLAYQLELFEQQSFIASHMQPPSRAEEERGVRAIFGTEIDMFDDYVDWERFNNRPISRRDQKFILNSKLKMHNLWQRMHKRSLKDKAKQAATSLRYLKRSSNQLIKALKALGAP
jgi:hypothetical protein